MSEKQKNQVYEKIITGLVDCQSCVNWVSYHFNEKIKTELLETAHKRKRKKAKP